MDKPRTSSSSKTALGTRVNTGFFQFHLPEKVNPLIQTRGLHTLTVTFFDFSGCREARKAGKVVFGRNLQGTALHRRHHHFSS